MRIATPDGEVAVRDLLPGMRVWTLDAKGQRVAEAITTVGHVPAPPSHQMVRVTMSDGRAVSASPLHPTCAAAKPAAATVDALARGQRFDGATIATSARQAYAGGDTWDLLPAGATGCYWANGVLLGSTLR